VESQEGAKLTMGSPIQKELNFLYQYANGCKFIIESGSGLSTKYLLKAKANDGLMYSIDVYDPEFRYPNVVYKIGWSIVYDDLVLPKDPLFKKSRYTTGPDAKVIFQGKYHMKGETDWIRRIISENKDKSLDFFFCDSGEYCGLAEWNIVKNVLQVGGRFAAHDIYYPKSIKCFQIKKEIKKSDRWHILVQTHSKQGLLIAEKIK